MKRDAMKYLIQLPEGLFGYEQLVLLKIDIATNKPKKYTLFVRNPGLVLHYVETTLEKEEQ